MSFTRKDGTEVTKSQIVSDMINYYHEAYDEDLTSICDLSTGSELRTLIESIAVEVYDLYYQEYISSQQYFVKTATGYFLDLLGCEAHLERKQSTTAYGVVTFTLKGGTLSTNYVIPQNTIILHRTTGNQYITAEVGIIEKGTLSTNVKVVAAQSGSDYNSSSGKLTAFRDVNNVRRDLAVTNNYEIIGGEDTETDDEFRERILKALHNNVFGTIGSYSTALENITGVHDVAFINPNNVTDHKINGKRCTSCTRIIYVNSTTKELGEDGTSVIPESVLMSCTNYMENPENHIIGHEFHIEPAQLRNVYFKVVAYCNDTVSTEEIYNALNCYFEGGTIGGITFTGLKIGEGIRKEMMIDAVEELPGIDQVESIKQLYYRSSEFPKDKNEWMEVAGTNTKEWTDANKFTYTMTNDVINKWGERTFNTIYIHDYQVGHIDTMDHKDSTQKEVIFQELK